MTFFGDFYSKAGSIKQEFELSSPAWMHDAEVHAQHCKRNCNIYVCTGFDFSVRES
ncbi:hypothetical protein [Methanosarcina horonobensis]|uniref:hypothetical protein n=1 Tax=Methanosarcina horonobensis TaxID=418008 RepID=UPI000B1363C7|nr:hypothetical protein [Methanosarcina horonobensis]